MHTSNVIFSGILQSQSLGFKESFILGYVQEPFHRCYTCRQALHFVCILDIYSTLLFIYYIYTILCKFHDLIIYFSLIANSFVIQSMLGVAIKCFINPLVVTQELYFINLNNILYYKEKLPLFYYITHILNLFQ